MGHLIDDGPHRVRAHLPGRERFEKFLDLVEVPHILRIQPKIEILGVQNDRHAVVDRPDQIVGLGGQDRADFDGFPLHLLLAPDPRESERLFIHHLEIERPGLLGLMAPFVESIRRDQATPFFERFGEDRFLADVLTLNIDEEPPSLGPRREEAPLQKFELMGLVVQGPNEGRDLLGGRDVVTRLPIHGLFGREKTGDILRLGFQDIAGAHENSLTLRDRTRIFFSQDQIFQ